MKKVLKPASEEEAVYYSDFSGKLLAPDRPVDIVINFNYGSKRDGDKIEWHITDAEFDSLIKLLKSKYDLMSE